MNPDHKLPALLSVLFLCAAAGAAAGEEAAWSKPVKGLRIRATLAKSTITTAEAPKFTLEIENASSRVRVRGADGRLLREIALPALGTVDQISGQHDGHEAFFDFSSYGVQAAAWIFWPEMILTIDQAAEAIYSSMEHGLFLTMRKYYSFG